MTENDPRGSGRPPSTPSGPMSERMQALLSRAAEEQLTEQRQVSAVLADLRSLVSGLGEQLRGTASSARLESVSGDLASLVAEVRMSTTALGERLDALSRRVDEQAASTAEVISTTGSGSEAVAVRVSALADDLNAQSSAVDRLTDAVAALGAFPDSFATLQREVSGLHDRLAPLSEVRSGLADLTARTGALEALRPEVAALASQLGGVATVGDVTRSRDSLVAALSERMERLEAAAARPVLTAQGLESALAPLLARLDEVAAAGPVVDRLGGLDARLGQLENRIGTVADQVTQVGKTAGAVPALASDMALVLGRVQELGPMRQELAEVRAGVTGLQEDSPLPSLVLGTAALREEVEDLGSRVAELVVPTADAVATAVSQQVTDRLVDELAPRVADVVLTRVAATLVEQVSGSIASSVQTGITEKVRAANADSERRISAHVDEAVLALAEALLRRRRGSRTGATALSAMAEDSAEVAAPASPAPTFDEFPQVHPADHPGAGDADAPPEPAAAAPGVETAAEGESEAEPQGEPEAIADTGSQSPDEDDEAEDVELRAALDTAPDVDEDAAQQDDEGEQSASEPGTAEAADADEDADEDEELPFASSTAPAAATPVTRFTLKREPIVEPTPDLDEDVEEPPVARTQPAAQPATQQSAPAPAAQPAAQLDEDDEDWDEDDEDGPPRRPWWRPGG